MTKAISRFDARLDEPALGDRGSGFKQHVVEEDAAVRNVDLERVLHGFRRQTDLPADDLAAFGKLRPGKFFLDCIGPVHVEVRMAAV